MYVYPVKEQTVQTTKQTSVQTLTVPGTKGGSRMNGDAGRNLVGRGLEAAGRGGGREREKMNTHSCKASCLVTISC